MLMLKYSQHPLFKHYVLPLGSDTKFHIHTIIVSQTHSKTVYLLQSHVMSVPVIPSRCILGLWME